MASLTLLGKYTTRAAVSSNIADIASSSHSNIARVVLKKGKSHIFVNNGNPMVYSGAIDRIVGRPPPKTGDLVLVTNGAQETIAWGLYNSVSLFRVRIFQTETDAQRNPLCILNMEQLLETRITAALKLRKSLGLPSTLTNIYRLINSEGDRLSGLVVDVFGDQVVVASSAAWVEKYKTAIENVLKRVTGTSSLVWRASVDLLKEEGLELENNVVSEVAKVRENGIHYEVSLSGQKTGFYADQRENRYLLGSISQEKSVLDLCCYTGGFALNAAISGASHVTGIDSSNSAIELAKVNAHLNKLKSESFTFIKDDIVHYMKAAIREGKFWDVIVLDPPKLAPNRKALENAIIKYRSLNALAMQLTNYGGLLMTCSCSGAMTQSHSFLSLLQEAAQVAKRRVSLVRQAGAGSDHPIDLSYPHGSYLTNCLLQVL